MIKGLEDGDENALSMIIGIIMITKSVN